MNIRYITLGLLTTFFLGSSALLTSCADELEVGKVIDGSAYNGVYENNAYLRDGKSNLVSNVVELYGATYSTSVKMGLSKVPTTATSAKVKIDPAYLAAYNEEHKTDFELYPQDLVTFENGGVLAVNVNAKLAEVGMTIQAGDALQADKTYAIPVAISDQSNDVTIKDEKARHCIYLVRDMRHASDTYKGEDVVKGYLFFEVNDVNPLNTFSFQLENGKLLWDVVVLFAANINYDAEAGRCRVQCNPNVQYLLDNNETYLQPLRKRGVKVLLGFLGNHDVAGLAQLSTQGAKDFAREVAQYCKAYNLDGINYDDEYSNYPDLGNPSFTTPGTAAAARLCYETKQAMPDKLVTVFAYGSMYGASTVDGVDIDNWVDIAVPNYGSAARPLGGMSKKKCAGSATEFNLGGGTTITDSQAQSLINNGYGWYMGFAPSPAKYVNNFGRLSGVRTLYGSPLAPPSIYYKKNDPKPYPFSEYGK